MSLYKDIHIGNLIVQRIQECDIDVARICKFINATEEEINKMYISASLDTDILLRWSKLLEYDFFRIYSQHLILYAPEESKNYKAKPKKKTRLPTFRKNIYTRDIINFILEMIDTGEMTKLDVIERYNIPKTTLYKWIEKYNYKTRKNNK